MNANERRRREDYRNAIEYLCSNLAKLTEEVNGTSWRQGLEAVKSTEPFTDPWYTAVRRLHELAEAADIPGGLGLTTPMGGRWPPGPDRSKLSGWACPTRSCTRIDLPDAVSANNGTAPQCHLLGVAMRPVEA